MLPVQHWRSDAVLRLLISIFICIYAGLLVAAVVHHVGAGKWQAGFLLVAIGGLASLAAALVLVRIPLSISKLARQLGVAMACFYAGMLLGAWAHKLAGPSPQSVLHMVLAALAFQGATILLVYLFLREHGVSWGEAFGLPISAGKAILFGIILAGVFLPVAWLLQRGSMEVLAHFPRFQPEEQQAVQTLRMAKSIGQRVMLGVITIGFAPLAEELLFRGVLYPWIRQFGYPRLALWVTSLLFGVVHFNLATFIPLALFSVVLTLLYQRQGNLLAPIAAHATFNALNFFFLFLVEELGQANPIK